jgi:predicted PurR-regulated permease PerM
MKQDREKSFLIHIAYYTTAALLILLGIRILFTWLFPFSAGLIIAVLLRPLIRRFSKAALLPRRHAAFIVTTGMYLLILILL